MKKKQPETVSREAAKKIYDLARAELENEYDATLVIVRSQCDREKANAVLAARDEALAIGRRAWKGT